MRVSPLRAVYAAAGASFTSRYGVEVVDHVTDSATEYNYVRNSVGITDFSFMQKFIFPEETGIDFLDAQLAGNVAKIRFGRVLHSFIADKTGKLIADCYCANNDDGLILLTESIVDEPILRSQITADGSVPVTDCTATHAIIGIDGFKAWEVARQLFGTDVLGLPYLAIECYTFHEEPVKLFRAGKTSEFGYLLMVPAAVGPALLAAVTELATALGGGLCGTTVHNTLRLEGRFFNIFAEGERIGDPLTLGLQWMIDFDKGDFPGREALAQSRSAGLQHKIIGIQTAPNIQLTQGMALYDGEEVVASVTATCYSPSLDAQLGLAYFSIDVAFAGLTLHLASPTGPDVKTISMPPIMPKSLSVKLDEI